MYLKKQEVLVHSWIKESPLLFCFVWFFFFALFSESPTPRVTKDLDKRQKDLFKETKLYMKPEKLD